MRLNDTQIRRLADNLCNDLLRDGGMTPRTGRDAVVARIEEIVRGNLAAEEELERRARTLLEEHLRAAPAGVDRQKLFLLIKKKLAEERGFPL